LNSVKKSLIYSFAENYLLIIIQLGSSMIIARLLSPEEIGQFSVGIAVLSIAHMLRSFGTGNYLIQEKNLTTQKIKTVFGITLLLSWGVAVALFFSRHWIAEFYNEQNLAIILAWMCINFIIIPFSSPAIALLRREMQFHKIFYINTISTLVSVMLTIYLAKHGYSYMSLVWGAIANIVATAILTSCFRPKDSFILPSLKNSKEIISFGGKTSLSNFIISLGKNTSELIIGKFLGFSKVAIFSKANTVNNLFSENILGAIVSVYHPFIAQSYRDKQPLNTIYLQTTAYISSIALPFYGLLILYAESIILILFGDQWLSATKLIQILSLSGMLQSFWSMSSSTLYAINKPGTVLTCETLNQSIKVSLIIIASFISLEMIAWSTVLSSAITLIIYSIALKKTIKISVVKKIKNILIPNLFLGITALSAPLYINFYYGDKLGMLYNMIYGVLSLSLVWLTTIILLNYPIKNEIRKLFPSKKKKMPHM
jgi:O-antigen/teichoic acid export membrane protein